LFECDLFLQILTREALICLQQNWTALAARRAMTMEGHSQLSTFRLQVVELRCRNIHLSDFSVRGLIFLPKE